MDFGVLIILLILTGYIASLMYLNSKAMLTSDRRHELPAKVGFLRDVINSVGLSFYGLVLLFFLIVAIGVLFFRDRFFPW